MFTPVTLYDSVFLHYSSFIIHKNVMREHTFKYLGSLDNLSV